MKQLTEHFSLEELTQSSTAERLSIDNTPPLEVVACLTRCAMGLERVRALLNQPMHIDSGYRSPALNQAIGGAAKSAHMSGFAADFKCPNFGTPKEVAEAIARSDLQFDQLICEGTWVHIAFDPAMRGQVLTAHFHAGEPTTYTAGLE